MNINLNEKVTVTLNEYGLKIWRDFHYPQHEHFMPKQDNTIKTELHTIMSVFGPFLFMGNRHGVPFVNNEINIEIK